MLLTRIQQVEADITAHEQRLTILKQLLKEVNA